MPLLAPSLVYWLATAAPLAPASSGAVTPPVALQEAREDEEPNDARFNPAQPDFTVVSLPTTLRVPRHKSAFRVTHRFTRPLGSGDLGDLVEDFFGFDNGAQIGLEYRFGLFRGAQIGIHRTSIKTIEFFGQYDAIRQDDQRPFGLAALVTIEGLDNFRDEHAPALGALLSHEFNRSTAVYLEPIWIGNTNPFDGAVSDPEGGTEDYTVLLGLGGRWRIRPTVYLVGEIAPRLAGYNPDVFHASFGVEKRAGGHSFQINFSNTVATTLADIARGGFSNDDWYIGFNISRKFF